MKLQVYIFLVISLYGVSAISTDPQVGNKKIAAIITSQMPPQIRGARVEGSKCDQPVETPEIINCKSTSGEYPTSKIICHCTGCSLMLKLTCYPDGNWYPTETNVCSNKNPATKCGLCKAENRPKNLKCIEDPINGYMNEERHCLCKLDCLEVTIKCGNDGLWFNSNEEFCEDTPAPVTYIYDDIQNVTFHRGNYTFSCPSGYKLDGPDSATCKNGKLDPERFPECIIDVQTTTTTEQITSQQTTFSTSKPTTSRPQQMIKPKSNQSFNLIYIIVGSTLFLFIIVVILIVVCAFGYRRKQLKKEEILKNNPIYKLEELTNVKDFMIVNDMYKKDKLNVSDVNK